RLPPRRRPAGAVGAAGGEAAAEAGGQVGPATSRGEAAGASLAMVLTSPLFGVGRRWGSPGREGRIPGESRPPVFAPLPPARPPRRVAPTPAGPRDSPPPPPAAPRGPPGGT